MRRVDIGAQLEESRLWPFRAVSTAARPVREAGLDKLDTDEHDGRTGHQRRKDALEDPWGSEGHEDFEKSAHTCGTDDCAVAVGARQGSAVRS